MKVLIISANALPAAPSGSAYVAGALRQAGHEVEVYDTLFAGNLKTELGDLLGSMQPDVVGISIRLVFGDVLDEIAPMGTRHIDQRPYVREVVDAVRQASPAVIVLGGPGFNYYARDWLDYLDVEYGLRGEGEESFPLFLERLKNGGDFYTVPGCVGRATRSTRDVAPAAVRDLNALALPAYDLFDLERYAARGVAPAVLTKRGCAFGCSYCPYARLEGKRYRLKSPARVVEEVKHILRYSPNRRIQLCDNSFVASFQHDRVLCEAFLAERLDFQWATSDLKPIGLTDDFCRMMEETGCYYANLDVESASETMLKRMRRGYSARQVRESLDVLGRSKLPYGASVMFGAPGETPETIEETLRVMQDYPFPFGVWVTLGVYMWTDYQEIVAEALASGYLKDKSNLFEGCVYLSPALSPDYLEELSIRLRARPGWKVQFNNPAIS